MSTECVSETMEMKSECDASIHVSAHELPKTSNMSSAKWSLADRNSPTLDSLPEVVLLELLLYLDIGDIYNLSYCGPNLHRVCRTRKLWCEIDDSCDGFSPSHSRLQSFFQDSTIHITLRSSHQLFSFQRKRKRDSSCLDQEFFKKLKNLPNLKTFKLYFHTLNITTFNLNYLPESLTELVLIGTHLFRKSKNQKTFFKDIDKILPNLKKLDLTDCLWVKSSVLNRIAKCRKLEYLSFNGCYRMEDLSTRFKLLDQDSPIFSVLKLLNLRHTDVCLDQLIKWPRFARLKSLHLQPPEYMEMYNFAFEPVVQEKFLLFLKNHDTIESLILRDCSFITNTFLLKELLKNCCKSLQLLDLTNTQCTERAVSFFMRKHHNPSILVLFNFLPGY